MKSKLTKKLHGKKIRIKARENCLDAGVEFEGTYVHYDRQRTFGMEKTVKGFHFHTHVFHRDEWEYLDTVDDVV